MHPKITSRRVSYGTKGKVSTPSLSALPNLIENPYEWRERGYHDIILEVPKLLIHLQRSHFTSKTLSTIASRHFINADLGPFAIIQNR